MCNFFFKCQEYNTTEYSVQFYELFILFFLSRLICHTYSVHNNVCIHYFLIQDDTGVMFKGFKKTIEHLKLAIHQSHAYSLHINMYITYCLE